MRRAPPRPRPLRPSNSPRLPSASAILHQRCKIACLFEAASPSGYKNFFQRCPENSGNFKGTSEIEALRRHTEAEAGRYAAWAHSHGYGTATFTAIGHDVMGEVMRLAGEAKAAFPNAVFFAGQLAFARETRVSRLLHNHTGLTLQRRFFEANLPFVVLPIRVEACRTPA